MAETIDCGKLKSIIEPPDLIELQKRSYCDFFQMDVPASRRKNIGLQAVFKEIFPIESYDGGCVLDFVSYEFTPTKKTPDQCLKDGETYAAPLHVKFRLKNGDEVYEEVVYMGEMPISTESASFVINGAERCIVSQLHRSPGICFERTVHSNGSSIFSFRLIPDHGSWVEVQFDASHMIYIYLDRQHRRRKFLAVTFLRALGYGANDELLRLYYRFEKINVSGDFPDEKLKNLVLKDDVIDVKSQTIIGRRYDYITRGLLKQMKGAEYETVEVVDVSWDEGLFLRNVQKDETNSEEEALKEIFMKLRPGDPPTVSGARQMLKNLFFDARRFDLGRVGRYKINQKLKLDKNKELRAIDNEDMVEALRYLINLSRGNGVVDDIDHLGSRRLKVGGELLENQCRLGLARAQRTLRERIMYIDTSVEKPMPQRLINPKSLSASVLDFFARSQLSQFMDQTNPLSELTHKRRMSALGPGGLSRERAGFEVRDVHTSHYGRICPIETPEGPNIGLISSLGTYARVNDFGFIETPYIKVKDGRVTGEVDYLTADQEENFVIAQANAPTDEKGRLREEVVSVRYRGEFLEKSRDSVQYIDTSPKQMVSVAAGLIPFLEHDDANRALMGSNMMRQAVPLLRTERAFVSTGLEKRVALDSRIMVTASEPGRVAYVSAVKIIVTPDGKLPKKNSKQWEAAQVYELRKFMCSNAGTCINQKPIVKAGQKVVKGMVLADGPCTAEGELALGRNVLVAFMPWGGYNFEDAILVSERLVREDFFTSVHIEKFEINARDTKLGPEEITRDIPNVAEEALRDLGPDGVIRIGARVKPGDILVGKVTPKSETELAPEERLLRAIFGEKAADVRDTSLRVPSGTSGIVMEVRASAQENMDREKMSAKARRQQVKQIEEEYKQKKQNLLEVLTDALSNVLLGEKIPLDVVNAETGEIIIPANRKITKFLLRKLSSCWEHIEVDPSPIQVRIQGIINEHKNQFAEIEMERENALHRISSGDDVEEGIVKQVRVYVASKKRLAVGDKMAGRHGNKGVIARIMKDEDMPFMPDGTPVDMVLNPLGVPSRMNVGQLYETQLGWVCEEMGIHVVTPIFDGIAENEIQKKLGENKLPANGKTVLRDGRTGVEFEQPVTTGVIYMLKLHHLVSDKIHARAVGPYSLVTQQPLGGKAQYGGQRFGEMEVWAMEAYSAAYALQELLTVKSDDVHGRTRIYEAIIKGENIVEPGVPESFNVLIKELQSLCLDMRLLTSGEEKQKISKD
ncbi:MAG: DNA-directed RNA polymerase subunit beta [Kiritimatiellae bacterium]|nr:DNA-directed RNA polymerase subunit beta [Kiritimatiellia bacterium]